MPNISSYTSAFMEFQVLKRSPYIIGHPAGFKYVTQPACRPKLQYFSGEGLMVCLRITALSRQETVMYLHNSNYLFAT